MVQQVKTLAQVHLFENKSRYPVYYLSDGKKRTPFDTAEKYSRLSGSTRLPQKKAQMRMVGYQIQVEDAPLSGPFGKKYEVLFGNPHDGEFLRMSFRGGNPPSMAAPLLPGQ